MTPFAVLQPLRPRPAWSRTWWLAGLLTALLGVVSPTAAAQTGATDEKIIPVPLAKHGVWSAYKYETPIEGQVCYAVTSPIEEKGDYTERGDVLLFVTTRTTENVPRRVTIVTGYTYLSGSIAQANVGTQKFALQTRNTVASARDTVANETMIKAMKAGTNMKVGGRSSRRTLTTDTYSLIGLTRTIAAIDKACPS